MSQLALVTGASSGIGEALAELLAAKGIPLILTGQNKERLEAVAAKCRSTCLVETHVADLSQQEGRESISAIIRQKKPDLIVNNAGFGFYGEALSHPTPEHSKMLDVNVKAVMELSLEGARALVSAKKEGIIVNISSVAAFLVFPYFATYAATKAFVNNFSEAIDYELQPYGIRVLASCPGRVYTRFSERAGGKKNTPASEYMTVRFAAEEILWQIEKKKKIHVFNVRYRLIPLFASLLPKRVQLYLLAKGMKSRIE